jgi:hypothetical protein
LILGRAGGHKEAVKVSKKHVRQESEIAQTALKHECGLRIRRE